MNQKNTDDLRQELMDTPDLSRFLAENQVSFRAERVSGLLSAMLERRQISKAKLARRSGMSEICLHQIFAGRRNPTRSRLICLCYGLGATLEETQELLRLGGMAQLYPRTRWDAILIYGLTHRVSVFELNDRLFEEGEEPLF